MCENAPDHLVGRVRRVGLFSFGAGWVQVLEFFWYGSFEILRKYWWNSLSVSILPIQIKCNLLTYQLETKIARASTLLDMDRNLEQRDLGKNTANEILMRGTDGREKSNKCNQCDSAFSRVSHLRTHLKIHSGEKSNKCNQCYYASAHTSHLRTHLKSHSGEKPHKCNQCQFASSQAGNLRRHIKGHSGAIGLKPDQCN